MSELFYESTTKLAQAIRTKELSSVEVVEACLARIEAVNPQINAVVHLTAEAALAQAQAADAALARGELRGPLHGVPMTVKGAWETAGVVTTGGTKGLAANVPERDATVIARARAAGAVILGMTNMPELSVAFESDNLVYGRTNNPYDLSRTPGGSGGGGGAAIAAGMAPFEIGADAGGSVRLPCHFSGIVGLRATTGRAPLTGYIPPSLGLIAWMSAPGPMARRVEDLALLLPIISGPDYRDPQTVPMPLGEPTAVDFNSLRVAFHTDNGIMPPTSETAAVVTSAAHALADAGLVVEEARPTGLEQAYELFLGLLGADGGAGINSLLQMYGTTETHPLLGRLMQLMQRQSCSTGEFAGLLARWDMYHSVMLSFLANYDVIVCPVNANPALPHGTTWDEDKNPGFSYTMAYNLTGWPGAVVRGGTSPEGLPIGVQVLARPGREDVALAVAQYLEMTMGGWQPPAI